MAPWKHETSALAMSAWAASVLLACASPGETERSSGTPVTTPTVTAGTTQPMGTAGIAGAMMTADVPTGAIPAQPTAGSGAAQPTGGSGASIPDAAIVDTAPPAAGPTTDGLPPGAERIAGASFFQRIVGSWSGINSNTPLGFDFPMAVDIAVSNDGLLFGKYEIDAENNVLWGFNIETYDGQDVLAYRNGGYLGGLRRDSRAKLVEHDEARGYYRFCAVSEHGVPVDGCNYIDARYTFSAPDKMLFEVFTRGTDPHVHWEATRIETHTLPNPFPATATSQGDGSAAWPAAAGIP